MKNHRYSREVEDWIKLARDDLKIAKTIHDLRKILVTLRVSPAEGGTNREVLAGVLDKLEQ